MKTCLILEDTPKGIKAKLLWQTNGFQDHLPDSIAMNLMANFVNQMEILEKQKALRLLREGSGEPPSATPATA